MRRERRKKRARTVRQRLRICFDNEGQRELQGRATKKERLSGLKFGEKKTKHHVLKALPNIAEKLQKVAMKILMLNLKIKQGFKSLATKLNEGRHKKRKNDKERPNSLVCTDHKSCGLNSTMM
jgi:hypothetical protein